MHLHPGNSKTIQIEKKKHFVQISEKNLQRNHSSDLIQVYSGFFIHVFEIKCKAELNGI